MSFNLGAFSNAAGGGGSTQIPVVTSAPGSPTEDQQWILKTVPANPTAITAELPTEAVNPGVNINVPTPTNQDIVDLFGAFVAIPTIEFVGAGALNISSAAGNMTIEYEALDNLNDLVAAINSYSQGLIAKDIAALAPGATGTDTIDDAIVNIEGPNYNVIHDGSLEQYAFQIRGVASTFSVSLTEL